MALLRWGWVLDNPILISGGLPAYPHASGAKRPLMRGVAAGRSAQRSGAATGGGGRAALPRPETVTYQPKHASFAASASAFRFTWLGISWDHSMGSVRTADIC